MSRISNEEFEKLCTDGTHMGIWNEAKRSREEEKHFRWEAIILDEEVQDLKKENADQEQIIQSWKHSCRIERELVESKTGTIERLRAENKKLRFEIEECKKGAQSGQ